MVRRSARQRLKTSLGSNWKVIRNSFRQENRFVESYLVIVAITLDKGAASLKETLLQAAAHRVACINELILLLTLLTCSNLQRFLKFDLISYIQLIHDQCNYTIVERDRFQELIARDEIWSDSLFYAVASVERVYFSLFPIVQYINARRCSPPLFDNKLQIEFQIKFSRCSFDINEL